MVRHYRVNVAVLALGIPFFHRSEVGGGFASVETGTTDGADALGLQFAAGSLPERSAGLNRFGMFREACLVARNGHTERAFAGFITSSEEESLSEARHALKQNGGTSVAVAWGGARGEEGWFHRTRVEAPVTQNWKDAPSVLAGLLNELVGEVPRTAAPGGASTFLNAMWNAAFADQHPFRESFLHNGHHYTLHTHWRQFESRDMQGRITNAQGNVTAEFRAFYDSAHPSGLPLRFEYQARSYLKLTFEVVESSVPIPSLFPTV